MAVLQLTVLSATGIPVPGAAIRLLSDAGVDNGLRLFGVSPVYAGANGVYTFAQVSGPVATEISLSPHVLRVAAPGFATGEIPYLLLSPFLNPLSITLAPVALPPGAAVSGPAFDHVSSLYSSVFTADALGIAGNTDERLQVVINGATASSRMLVPAVNYTLTANVQARLRVDPNPRLVSDGVGAVSDPDFTAEYSFVFFNVTPAGKQIMPGGTTLFAAPVTLTTGPENTLSDYIVTDTPAKWLSPWGQNADAPMPIFAGHYADALIWLDGLADAALLTLSTAFFNGAGIEISVVAPEIAPELIVSGKALRVRVPDPVAGAVTATLTVMQDGAAQSLPLYIHYRNA